MMKSAEELRKYDRKRQRKYMAMSVLKTCVTAFAYGVGFVGGMLLVSGVHNLVLRIKK